VKEIVMIVELGRVSEETKAIPVAPQSELVAPFKKRQ
jgi:hypothetical protein